MIRKFWDLDKYNFGDEIGKPLPPYGSVTIIDPPFPVIED